MVSGTAVIICLSVFVSIALAQKSYIPFAVQHTLLGNPLSDSPTQIILRNLQAYANYAHTAAEHSGDIIVYPEGTLGWIFAEGPNTRAAMLPYCTDIPEVVNGHPHMIPCNNSQYDWQLQALSCLATQHEIAVVVNVCERYNCSKTDTSCPVDGHYQYNADVVFAKDGHILAKYRKSHLFGGGAVFDQAAPVPTYFDLDIRADFTVRFGMFICFDIQFKNPANLLVQQGIKDFVFSSW